MSHPDDRPREELFTFHRIVAEGSLDELRAALDAGAPVNAQGNHGRSALNVAIETGDVEKMKLLIEHGADPELTDDFNNTALRCAVERDFAEGVRYLLGLGVDRGYHPRYPLKKTDYATTFADAKMPDSLKAVMSEREWRDSQKEAAKLRREMDQNPTVEPIIGDVQSVEVLNLFLKAGDDLGLAPAEVRRQRLGLETGGELRVTDSEYRRHKSRQFGRTNPERMDFPFWQEMIRTGANSYAPRCQFDDKNPFQNPGAVWCYERYGSTLTPLPDGRYVQIAGEHEDHYDPDLCIYNDVVIHDGRGNFEIYGYPPEVFPPTDFHTATLCRDGIVIIGNLGYPKQRQLGHTPVYRLALDSWRIEPVPTHGDVPGWIHDHRATYDAERNTIRISGGTICTKPRFRPEKLVPNQHDWELNLTRLQWRKIE